MVHRHAPRQLARLDQIQLSSELVDRAATLVMDVQLRSLGAIYRSAAQVVELELRAVVTYDHGMEDAGEDLGLSVEGSA